MFASALGFASVFAVSGFASSSPFVDGGWVLGVELGVSLFKLEVFSAFCEFERVGVLLLDSIIESVLRCGGVGVEGLRFGAGGVVKFRVGVHTSDLNIKVGDGVPVVSEAAAMRSSEEHLVCAKDGGVW